MATICELFGENNLNFIVIFMVLAFFFESTLEPRLVMAARMRASRSSSLIQKQNQILVEEIFKFKSSFGQNLCKKTYFGIDFGHFLVKFRGIVSSTPSSWSLSW